MAKSGNSSEASRLKIVSEEIASFNKIVDGHRKLLNAIGGL